MTHAFVADSFRKSFGAKDVLKSATVWADPGRITLVLGRNGSGKSTLIRCAVGLVRAEQGVMRLAGEHHPRPRLSTLANAGLFYLPDKDLLSRRMPVGHQMMLMDRRFVRGGDEHVGEVARRLGIPDRLDQRPTELSGGELRRAEVAVAVVRRPSVLIADEPLAEIEPKDRAIVGAMLRALADEGCAVLITGHDVRDLMELADEVIWMAAGTTHGLGTPEEAARHHQFRQEYLGPNF